MVLTAGAEHCMGGLLLSLQKIVAFYMSKYTVYVAT